MSEDIVFNARFPSFFLFGTTRLLNASILVILTSTQTASLPVYLQIKTKMAQAPHALSVGNDRFSFLLLPEMFLNKPCNLDIFRLLKIDYLPKLRNGSLFPALFFNLNVFFLPLLLIYFIIHLFNASHMPKFKFSISKF